MHTHTFITLHKQEDYVIYLHCKRKLAVESRNSCRDLFKRLEILTLPCEYIFSLTLFITNNDEHFQTNADVHCVNTRYKHYLHKPTASLSSFQKSTHYAGIKIFNSLPSQKSHE
jgi:hypothetical protein